jgi:hypothetical protein
VCIAEEEVRLTASISDDLSAALARIEQRIKSVEDEVGSLGRKAAESGVEGGKGFDKFGESVQEAGGKARRAKGPIKDVGDAAADSGVKAAAGSSGFTKLGGEFDKMGKKGGDLKTVFWSLAIPTLVTGVYALVGAVSALGAGAAIAIGGMAPLVGVAAGALPIFAAVKLAMLAWKLAATQLKPTLDGITGQFKALGPVIASGGLQAGLDYFSRSIGGLVKVTGGGLAGLGAELGIAAHNAGDLAKSAPFLDQVSRIFAGLRPILGYLLAGLQSLAQAALNVGQAAIPMATKMAETFSWVTGSLRNWTAQQLANGQMAAFLDHAWSLFLRTCGVLVDFLVGLFNIFRIGASYSDQLGLSVENTARRFREWTASGEGVARINQYFRDSLPALHEMGLLLGAVIGGLGSLGANANIAPLLAQLRTELGPALGDLVHNLTGQQGLGPALISAAAALAQLFAGLDFSGLTLFIQAIAGAATALAWLAQNVPGVNFLVSALLTSLLGFKLLGPVFGAIGGGLKAFGWMYDAVNETEKLSASQQVFAKAAGPVLRVFESIGSVVGTFVVPALRSIATAGVAALIELSTALVSTPVGWIILAIMAVIGVLLLLWFKCAWFRDAVISVWGAIKVAAVATWEALKTAFFAVINFLVSAWQGAVSVFNSVIGAVVGFFVGAWGIAVAIFQAVISAIVSVAQLLWIGISPIVSLIVAYFQISWAIIQFIVQVAIFIIMGTIALLAIAAQAVWSVIVAGATWAWGVIVGFFNWVASVAAGAWMILSLAAQVSWGFIMGIVMWVWGLISGFFGWVASVAAGAWTILALSAQVSWAWITGIVAGFWAWISPFFSWVGSAGSAAWQWISDAAGAAVLWVQTRWQGLLDFLSGLWATLSGAGRAVWDGISSAALSVAGTVQGAWQAVVGVVRGAWNAIAGGWNSIPSITVPDWVPLVGGKSFSLPKLPMLYSGGYAPGGSALVGEQGPEPVVRGGHLLGMVGQRGPEVASIPRGGYVVPNLGTLAASPGLTRSIPPGVASAVSAAVPGYGAALAGGSDHTAALAREVRALADAVGERPPPIVANSMDVAAEVESALRQHDRERALRGRYHY